MSDRLVSKEAIIRCMEDSNLMKHALDELELAGYGKDAKGLSLQTREDILELLTVFCSHGHSDTLVPFEFEIFRRLAKWSVLTPLTFTDDEFIEVGSGVFQNRRKFSFFKENGRIYDIDSYVTKTEKIKRKDSGVMELLSFPFFSEYRVYERDGNIATGRYFRRCFLPINCESWMPKEPVIISTIGIEISKDYWTDFFEKDCNEIKTLESMYEIKWEMSEEWKGKELC